jgi:pimeloyl-ACP methyl ester carboxylesterase
VNAVPRLALVASAIILAALSFSCSSTPPMLGEDGKVLPGSIASLERVELNGRKEWITLRGRDAKAPVLLWLAGGPGGTDIATVRRELGALEERFVVAGWDQPGAGKSYSAAKHKDLSLDMYVEDAAALVELLCARFGKEKIFIAGESWGSFLGVHLAERLPGRIAAFFGTGQMVAFAENDRACYGLMLDWYRAKGDDAKIKKLERQGPPPYYGRGVSGKLSAFLMDTFKYLRDEKGVRGQGDTLADIFAPEYGPFERVRWVTGILRTLDEFYPKLWDRDLRKEVPRLEVPAYFLIGRLDINASIPLLEDYVARLEAPAKEVFWFERSGHTPWSSESEAFVERVEELAALYSSGL